ncbi:MAG: transketolase [Ruminococcus sp.]|nr:transketolase [Ruminococcus sp.]
MQRAYMSALYELIRKDNRVVSCLSDSGTDYDELIAREFPDRVINFGISENNQVTAAAGMAAVGKIPFVYTTGAFLAYRSYEFIRDDVCMQNRNVKIVGMGSGLSWSTLGATHHATEDLALLKNMPNLTVITPASPKELIAAVNAAYEIDSPVYIRMGMSAEKEIYDGEIDFEIGKNEVIADGEDAIVFVTGSIVSQLLEAKQKLNESGKTIKIVNVHTIAPLNKMAIASEIEKFDKVFSLEEHNVNGGLGSSIADVIAEFGLNKKLTKIGLHTFGTGFGTHSQVLKANKLDSDSIFDLLNANI